MLRRRLVQARGATPGCSFPRLALHGVWCTPPGGDPPSAYVAKRLADTTGCATAEAVDLLGARDIAALPKYGKLMRMTLAWQQQHDTVRIIVVAEFTSLLRCVTKLAPDYTRELYGEHTRAERSNTLRWFRSTAAGVRILCLSLACEGLNLPGAQHMIILHPSESFVREEQAMYRMCRMGTTGTRHVHCMYTRGGCSDPALRRLQLEKVRALTRVFPEYARYHTFLGG
jgi:ERCC4-related helicase